MNELSTSARIDGLLLGAVDRGEIPGIIAIGFNDRELIYANAFGKRGLSAESPAMTLDTVFWYASMTKATVAAAAMLLVQEGRAELDAPVKTVLPELAFPQVLEGYTPDGKPIIRPARGDITLRHLLTHTSGFGYDIWNADVGRFMDENGLVTLAKCLKASLHVPLTFDPGERWQYGISIDWAGQFVEAVTGVTLGAFLEREFFQPLGMADTAFGLGPDQRRRLLDLHQREADGRLKTIVHELAEEPEFHMGGGGLYGTAPDYVKFLQMLLRGGSTESGQQIFMPRTVGLMFENSIGDLHAGILRPVLRNLALDSDFFPGMEQKWGLSFLINPEPSPHGRSAGSLSWAGLANSYYWIDPTRKVGGVIATQILPFADPLVVRLYQQFERALYDGLM
jgi:methyl acetate hydrolase